MTTAHFDMAARQAVACALAWALFVGGWLVLGTLGRMVLPQWAGGLGLVALWLAAAGALLYIGRPASHLNAHWRLLVGITGPGAAFMLAWASNGGGAAPALFASVLWGALLAAASRVVGMMRTNTREPPPPFASAAAGAALAWAIAADSVAWPAIGTSIGLAIAATVLVGLSPRGNGPLGGTTGLFGCALPLIGRPWRDPSGWAFSCARWSMVPMMASLAVMTEWCTAAASTTPSQVIGAHLAAMLVPPLLLHLSGAAPRNHAWIAALMASGLAFAGWAPGLQGVMGASLLHSLAWGLAWFILVTHSPQECTAKARSGLCAVVAPACAVYLLGLALAGMGPMALTFVHVALGFFATVGAVFSIWRPAVPNMEN